MSTLVTICGGVREEIEVRETFEECIDKIAPINPPNNSMDGRATNIWRIAVTSIEGDGEVRALIPHGTIYRVVDDFITFFPKGQSEQQS